MVSSVEKGNSFEDEIFEFLSHEIDSGGFPINAAFCKIFKKKKYYSKDRSGLIEFDVAVEVYYPGTQECSLVWLFECKNYKSPVGVGEVESFYQKAEQVAGAKSKLVLATKSPIQKSAREFARSKGMGVLRHFSSEGMKWELYRSTSVLAHSSGEIPRHEFDSAFSNEAYQSRAFDVFFESGFFQTVSMWDFVENMLVIDSDSCKPVIELLTSRPILASIVPFIEDERLEECAGQTLTAAGYRRGAVNLDDICRTVSGLTVEIFADADGVVLGSVSFSPLNIKIYKGKDEARNRFTLAHEISHVILGHGKHIRKDICETEDIESLRSAAFLPKDIRRIEYQANFHAACLLMPKDILVKDFLEIASSLGVENRGFGHLFLDDQPCNISGYMRVTNSLKAKYSVSRAAVHIRLQSLGLLNDARPDFSSFRSSLSRL